MTDEIIKTKVTEMLKKHKLTYRIDWNLSGKPFLTPQGKLVNATVEAVEKFTQIRPHLDTGGGTSDACFIATMGAEVVEFGPLNQPFIK